MNPIAADDVTESVLDAVLAEALTLTDEIAAAGSLRRAFEAPDSRECAARLRLAARLSRIAAWASLRGTDDPERLEIAAAALEGALNAPPLDPLDPSDGLTPFFGRVDRLAERARRLDSLFCGQAVQQKGGEAPRKDGAGATILPFRRPEPTAQTAAEPGDAAS